LSLLLYDVTTLYFEAENEDELRKVGYSNYAEVAVMPRSWWLWWCSCCSAGLAGVARAA
jgi:NADH:ubiquinone oxidoreductase subunit